MNTTIKVSESFQSSPEGPSKAAVQDAVQKAVTIWLTKELSK